VNNCDGTLTAAGAGAGGGVDGGTMQVDDQAEMMKLLQSADSANNERRVNADLRAKIYEQTRLITELRHDEVNRQQTSKARRRRR